MKSSWKTTVGGVVAALGSAMTAAFLFGGVPQWVGAVGAGLTSLSIAWIGIVARDNDVTSEQAGAAPLPLPAPKPTDNDLLK